MTDATSTEYTLDTDIDEDMLLDDIEIMPGFVTPPSGAYLVTLEKGVERKKINDANYYSVEMTIQEVLDVQEKALEPGEVLPKEGDMATMIFARKNKFGASEFVKFMQPIAAHFNCRTIGEAIQAAKGISLVVVIRRKYNEKRQTHNISVVKSQVAD